MLARDCWSYTNPLRPAAVRSSTPRLLDFFLDVPEGVAAAAFDVIDLQDKTWKQEAQAYYNNGYEEQQYVGEYYDEKEPDQSGFRPPMQSYNDQSEVLGSVVTDRTFQTNYSLVNPYGQAEMKDNEASANFNKSFGRNE